MIRQWLLQIDIDRSNKATPIYQQIYDQFISLISSGVLKSGDILPSSRELSEHLSISRKSVVRALDFLIIDGWIVSKERVGLFVRDNISKNINGSSLPNDQSKNSEEEKRYRLIINDGIPNSAIAPIEELSRAYRKIFNRYAKWHILGYNDPKGDAKFRDEISKMVNSQRGLQSTSAEICITRGSQMALFLTANSFMKRGDTVIFENPGYSKALKTFTSCGINIEFAEVDNEGIDTEEILSIINRTGAKAIYLTPQHQYPTTVTLSNERRIKLIEIAIKYNLTIIEDDYDCDFHFTGRIIMPLSRLLPKKNYIYIGSFSKILAPSVRVGFITSHQSTIDEIGEYRSMIDVQGDNIMDLAVLELIRSGEIRRHIRRSIRYYKERRDYFASLLKQRLSEIIEFTTPQGGLAFWICFNSEFGIEEISNLLKKCRIKSNLIFDFQGRVCMRVGYATLSDDDIEYFIHSFSTLQSKLTNQALG